MLSLAKLKANPNGVGGGKASAEQADGDLWAKSGFTLEALNELFAAWRGARGVLLAVSGGPDSVALMLLAAEWARRGDAPPLSVATVDHSLREESRREAEQVGLWASALGLPHRLLVWDGSGQKSRVQERARQARYELLFAQAAEIGADIVATAHHADDQAETILFRLLRGSGLAGLAGMAQSCERDGLLHSRPLLHCAKTQLIAVCEAAAHPFFEDPSNQDPAYARTRMRALRGFFSAQGLDGKALLRLGRRAARAEAALAELTEIAHAKLIAKREPGVFAADFSSIADQPEEVLLRILAREIESLGGSPRILRLARIEILASALQAALRAGEPLAATLGGCAIRLRRDRMLTISREGARRRGCEKNTRAPCGEAH